MSDRAPQGVAALDRRCWNLPQKHVDALAAIGTLRAYPADTVVMKEGEPGDTLFIIVRGRVRIFLGDGNSREVLLNEFGPGDHFGEMMLDNGPRSASVITAEPCRFSVLTRDQVDNCILTRPELAVALIRMLIGRIRALTRTVGAMALLDVYGRVSTLLVDLAREVDGQLFIDPRPTHHDIASRVGASREMVGRIMKELRSGGYIEIRENRMIVLRPPPKSW